MDAEDTDFEACLIAESCRIHEHSAVRYSLTTLGKLFTCAIATKQ